MVKKRSRPGRPGKSLRGTRDRHRFIVALTFDFDAESCWIEPAKTTSPSALSRGTYGATEGVPRILKLLKKYNLPATFFIPGYVADKHPAQVKAIAQDGHEIGHHGYLHEPPNLLRPEQEKKVIAKGIAALQRVTGKRPRGFRSPSAELSPQTLNLLAKQGFLYDSSLMGADRPYWAGGSGGNKDIVEVPMSIELTDTPHFMFMYTTIVLPGLSSPSKVEKIWQGDFDGLYAEGADAVLVLTGHPQVIGRPHRMHMLERFLLYMLKHQGIWFAPMQDIADYFKQTKNRNT